MSIFFALKLNSLNNILKLLNLLADIFRIKALQGDEE